CWFFFCFVLCFAMSYGSLFFFFFSSRRRHTRCYRDWSSDVCSSDLWCALSGDPEDIYKTDAKVKELLPRDKHLHHWLDMAREKISFQGLPARICWIGLGERDKVGLAFNEMVGRGEVKAPV